MRTSLSISSFHVFLCRYGRHGLHRNSLNALFRFQQDQPDIFTLLQGKGKPSYLDVKMYGGLWNWKRIKFEELRAGTEKNDQPSAAPLHPPAATIDLHEPSSLVPNHLKH
jgi:hypothetical protein